MSIKSVLNNNISLQTNILESRGHYPRDVVCQNGNYTQDNTSVTAPTITLESEAATATAGGILRGLAFTLPATTADESNQVLTIPYPAAHGWTADDQIIEVVQNQTSDANLPELTGTQIGLITASFASGTTITVNRCLGNIGADAEKLAASYVELRVIDRYSTT